MRNIFKKGIGNKESTTIAGAWQMHQLEKLGGEEYLKRQTNDKNRLPRVELNPNLTSFIKWCKSFKKKENNTKTKEV
jgi:hypothetical protein